MPRRVVVKLVLEDDSEVEIDLLEVEDITDESGEEITQTPPEDQAVLFHMEDGDVHTFYLQDQLPEFEETILQRIDPM